MHGFSRIASLALGGWLVVSTLTADDAFEASADLYAQAEAGRQAAVRRQVRLNDFMRWRVGLPPANGVFYYPLPPSLEAAYANGYFPGGPDEDIFTPWPYIPGDIWGFQHTPTVRQPIGQVERQTGPNRWESRPVYAAPLKPLPPHPGPEAFAGPAPRVEAEPSGELRPPVGRAEVIAPGVRRPRDF